MIFNLIRSIPLKLWTYAGLFFSALSLIGLVYKSGGDRVEVKNIKSTLKAVKRRNEIEDRVGNASDDDVLEQLRKNGWIR